MIQQASFQSELIAQATFQCSTFAHEFRADYPTKNANSIESCGAMANAVSLLTAAPVGLPGFEPTHSLEMLLGDGYDLVRHQRVGNISSALSGFPTTSQFELEESKSRDVLLAPGFYNENHEISLPNKRNCGVDGSESYSSCRVTSCVPATSCLPDRLNLPGIGDTEIISYSPRHNDKSVDNKVCVGIERCSSGISVGDNSIPSNMESSFSATRIEANCVRSVSTSSLQSTTNCHLPVTKLKQPMEVLQCGDIAPVGPPRARDNSPTTFGPGSVPLTNYQLLNVEYSESCELLMETPLVHCGTLDILQSIRPSATRGVDCLAALSSRPRSSNQCVPSPSSSSHIDDSESTSCPNQPYYGPIRPGNCGDFSKLFCGYGHEPLLRLAPDIDICVAPFNSPVLSSDSFSKPHFKSIASVIAPP
ncbi:hypothetical protein PR002_g8827 [Phytophthora rubi]|nr:hypothetical protein PR002_g8827 [Phytophthora rubi]